MSQGCHRDATEVARRWRKGGGGRPDLSEVPPFELLHLVFEVARKARRRCRIRRRWAWQVGHSQQVLELRLEHDSPSG